jgi:fluoride exporter
MSVVLLVAAGGAVGAVLRYLTDQAVQRRHDSVFPWGTFTVNGAGSMLFGLLVTAVQQGVLSAHMLALLGTGLCGALTTYSTFGYETARLVETGSRFFASANVLATVATTLGAATLGRMIALALWG